MKLDRHLDRQERSREFLEILFQEISPNVEMTSPNYFIPTSRYNSISFIRKHSNQLYVMISVYSLMPALTASNVLISPLLLLLQSSLKPVCILGVKSNSIPVEMR